MPTLMQKIKLAIRGWNRRREEANQSFVERNAWSSATAPQSPDVGRASARPIVDIDGLVCAFLDESGRIAYYLDTDTGEVIEIHDGTALAAPRYRRVPGRSEQSDAADRRAFAMKHQALLSSVGSPDAFRQALGKDRALERAWYNFKNDRAIAAINAWLAQK
jgi:hypothetical protein